QMTSGPQVCLDERREQRPVGSRNALDDAALEVRDRDVEPADLTVRRQYPTRRLEVGEPSDHELCRGRAPRLLPDDGENLEHGPIRLGASQPLRGVVPPDDQRTVL